MSRAFRPKSRPVRLRAVLFRCVAGLLLRGGGALLLAVIGAGAARAQAPISSSYSTRDGRIVSYVMACVSTDGSFTAQPCGVAGFPVHVVLDGGSTAVRSAAWVDASLTATATATTPALLAAVAGRTGLHVWNVGTLTACLNYTAVAVASGSGCAAGSVPIPAGSAYLEDQPGNVSPEAISLVCAGASCPLTIKVR